jgi:ribosomal protein S18 acetylase RimI-like enzyme
MVEDDISFIEVKDDIGITGVCSLAETIWYEFFPSIISLDQIEYMLKKFLSREAIEKDIKNGYRYFLCKDGREYIGFISVQPKQEWNSISAARRLFLSKLYLVQEYRGVHLCSRLMKKIRQLAEESRCTEIYLTVNKYNSHAIDVYYHYGFRNEKSVETDIGNGFIMDDYVMSCSLENFNP